MSTAPVSVAAEWVRGTWLRPDSSLRVRLTVEHRGRDKARAESQAWEWVWGPTMGLCLWLHLWSCHFVSLHWPLWDPLSDYRIVWLWQYAYDFLWDSMWGVLTGRWRRTRKQDCDRAAMREEEIKSVVSWGQVKRVPQEGAGDRLSKWCRLTSCGELPEEGINHVESWVSPGSPGPCPQREH